jgi:hypothetical protein
VTTRELPLPIKPRAMKRHRNGTGSTEYVTSDGWLKFTARYHGSQLLGFTTETLRAPELPQKHGIRRLEQLRDMYCAPDGNVPWLVCDMDDGIVRAESSRAAIVEWACNHHLGKVISRTGDGNSWYEYQIGDSREDSTMVWICRADEIHWHGFDPVQEPWYPYPDEPHEVGPRALRTHDERFQ